jgi:phosphoribosylglycinamide formyltransferase-1
VGGAPHPGLPPQGGKGVVRIAVLVSGDGSNLEALLQAQKSAALPQTKVVLVLSSKAGAQALERARRHRVESVVVERSAFPDETSFQNAVLRKLVGALADVVCLAGYLKKLGPEIIRAFRGRILNIHPALLPKYGGPGMYGRYVHEAVLAAGEKESGCSVHVVDEDFDHGPVLAQVKVPVLPGDSADSLGARVLVEEHKLYPEVLKDFCQRLCLTPNPLPKGERAAKPRVRRRKACHD